jgi:hypothetical protein
MRCELALYVVAKYNCGIFMQLLQIVYNTLTPTFIEVEPTRSFTLKLGVFGILVSTKEVAFGLLKA